MTCQVEQWILIGVSDYTLIQGGSQLQSVYRCNACGLAFDTEEEAQAHKLAKDRERINQIKRRKRDGSD